jgi:ABC-type spermidine/putrescine transport system permease subunit I
MTGDYIIPNILGGGTYEFVGNLIGDQFNQAQNQPFGSALAIGLMAALSVFVVVYILFATKEERLVRRRPVAKYGFTVWALATYAFLYLPILVMALFAFNRPSAAALADFHGSNMCSLPPDKIGNIALWNGATTCWFSAGLHDPDYIPAIVTSLQIAAETAVIATALGLCAALALARMKPRTVPFDVLVYLTLVAPEIDRGRVVDLLRSGAPPSMPPSSAGRPSCWARSYSRPVAMPIIRQGSGWATPEEAAYDLGSGPWFTFRQVTLPDSCRRSWLPRSWRSRSRSTTSASGSPTARPTPGRSRTRPCALDHACRQRPGDDHARGHRDRGRGDCGDPAPEPGAGRSRPGDRTWPGRRRRPRPMTRTRVRWPAISPRIAR